MNETQWHGIGCQRSECYWDFVLVGKEGNGGRAWVTDRPLDRNLVCVAVSLGAFFACTWTDP
jgi:hypothetical protein